MSDDIEVESFDQRVYEAAITIPPRINAENRDEWYGALLTFHTHFYPSATPKYRAEFGKLRKALADIQEMRITDPDEFDFQMFEIMNRWAVECSKLYDDLGLKFRTERRHGLKHEEVEP